MTTTDDKPVSESSPPPPPWQKGLKRYGPIVAVVALIAGAVVIFGGGGGDDDDGGSGGGTEVASDEDLIRSGPMTPEKAELLGEEVDFGPTCDTDLGRIMLKSVYAPPCVEPFEGDNGGATSAGVTADAVTVVFYRADPALDPLTAATIENAGADVNPESAADTVQGFADLYNQVYETYGRTVDVEVFTGTGAGDDTVAAQADAIEIAEKDPFAVIGGPSQAYNVFAAELASRGIICGPTCALASPESVVEANEPLLWGLGPTPDQAAALASEAIGNLAGPGPAELAGDEAMQSEERKYALLHYDNADGDFAEVFQAYQDELSANGIELTTDIEFTLDLARAQENARTYITQLREAGITTIIYTGDPLTPGYAHRGGDRPGLLPRVDPGVERPDGHLDLRPADRRRAVAERVRRVGRGRPRRAVDQRRVRDLGLGLRRRAAEQHGQRARATAAHDLHGHPPRRPRADARDVPRRPLPLPGLGRRADQRPDVARRSRRVARARLGRHRRHDADLVGPRRPRARTRRATREQACTATPTAASATRSGTCPPPSRRPACSTSSRP